MLSGRQCHYEVLGLQRNFSADEVRSAYKRPALQRHPDKLVNSGLSQAVATAQSYEVVSDLTQKSELGTTPNGARSYSSHVNSAYSVRDSVIPNFVSFFSNTVFFRYLDSGIRIFSPRYAHRNQLR